jgi:hypothetical protein
MNPARHLPRCLAGLAMVFVSSCSTPKTLETAPVDTRSWWKGDGVAGKPRIVINLSDQRVRYYKGGELVGMSPISSGKESTGTMNGRFSIIQKDLHHRSSLFGVYMNSAGDTVVSDVDTRKDPRPPGTKFLGANMRYFMRIVGGIGMHEGYLPGYPASHGCIRLPTKMAAIFFHETPLGTPVEIVGHGSLASSEQAIPIGHDTVEVLPGPQPTKTKMVVAAKHQEKPRFQEVMATAKPQEKKPKHQEMTAAAKPQEKLRFQETTAASKPKPMEANKPKETVRRAVVPLKKRLSRLRYGETLFLE